MGIAYRKNNSKQYIQYTIRLEEKILEDLKVIAEKEDISVNNCINQTLQFGIEDYYKNHK